MSYWRCWRCDASNDEPSDTCENCSAKNHPRNKAPTERADLDRCARCGDTSKSTMAFHQDTPVVADRGVRLCPSCWVPALRRRAEESPDRCPDCGKTVAEHIAEAREMSGSEGWAARFATRRDGSDAENQARERLRQQAAEIARL